MWKSDRECGGFGVFAPNLAQAPISATTPANPSRFTRRRSNPAIETDARGPWTVVRDPCCARPSMVCARQRLSVALPAMVGLSVLDRLTLASELDRGQPQVEYQEEGNPFPFRHRPYVLCLVIIVFGEVYIAKISYRPFRRSRF